MCDWSDWTQRVSTDETDKVLERLWFAMSFPRQMAEIEGELSRVIRDERRLERIRKDADYVGEPQVIHRAFEHIKKDPKNMDRVEEVKEMEKRTYQFLIGSLDAPSQEELSNAWGKYLDAYIAELGQEEGEGIG